MFHVSQEKTYFVCYSQRPCLGKCNVPWSLHPSQSQLSHWQIIPNQIKRTKKIKKRKNRSEICLSFSLYTSNILKVNLDELRVQDRLRVREEFYGLRKLGNICCGHKMFLNKIRNIFCVPDTKFVTATNVRARTNGETFVSATMCPQQCDLVCQGLNARASGRVTIESRL